MFSVTPLLSSRGLMFRGDVEHIFSQYKGILELIVEYDPSFSSHIDRYENKDRRKSSYLLSTICEEIIEKTGNKVQENIIKDIQEAKYLFLSIDSTPDVSHTDQLTVVLRYVRLKWQNAF
ncbi:zinc finger MYM-type protein 1 [Trichonephila clavipes]|nr:zinc finger MYM-type protein 1 [Trichonephila clavipes]